MSNRLEKVATALLTVAALGVAAAAIHREFFASRAAAGVPDGAPEYLGSWEEILAHGRLIGDADAPVKLIEFVDFECPFCKRYHPRVQATLQRFAPRVAVVFVHLPLSNHRFAVPSARAAECADEQGRFSAMADALYSAQDSLGLKTWMEIGRTAGIQDTSHFARCLSQRTSFPRIDSGLAVAKRLGIRGTPTVIANGWRFPVVPSDSEMDRVITALLEGRRPF